jgi:hypothetical protein
MSASAAEVVTDDRRERMAQRQELQRLKREEAEATRKMEEERKRMIEFEKAQKRQALLAAKMQEMKRLRAEKLEEEKRAANEKRHALRLRQQEKLKLLSAQKAAKKEAHRAERKTQAADSLSRSASLASLASPKASGHEAHQLARMFHVKVRASPSIAFVTQQNKDGAVRIAALKKELEKARRAATQVQQSQKKTTYPVTDAAVPDPVPQHYLRAGLLCKLYPLCVVASLEVFLHPF